MRIIVAFCLSLAHYSGISQADAVRVLSNGRVGIGINTPSHLLDIKRATNANYSSIFTNSPTSYTAFTSTFPALYLANSYAINNNYVRLNFGDGDNAASAAIASRIENHSTNGGSLEMWTRSTSGGGITRRMAVQNDGKVVIGTGVATELITVRGNAAKSVAGPWVGVSDERLKKDIKPFEDGLEQILQIDPVTYRFNGGANISDTETEHVGIIAQDMQKIAPYTVEEISIEVVEYEEVAVENDMSVEPVGTKRESYFQFDPTALTYMLINAVKEQQSQIEDLKKLVESQQAELITVDAVHSEIVLEVEPRLMANQPNPARKETLIRYRLPKILNSASLDIYDLKGNVLKSHPINHEGWGEVRVDLSRTPAGVYSYSLVIDGKLLDTKKMIVH